MNDLLDDSISESPRKFELASKNQRFVNHIVDQVVIVLIHIVFLSLQIFLDPESLDEEKRGLGGVLLDYMVTFIAIIVYYTVLEFYLKGQTIGKLVTGTMAVTLDGSPLTFNKALTRSLVRCIPFEAFSYLGSKDTGWHDDMTETLVVKKPKF